MTKPPLSFAPCAGQVAFMASLGFSLSHSDREQHTHWELAEAGYFPVKLPNHHVPDLRPFLVDVILSARVDGEQRRANDVANMLKMLTDPNTFNRVAKRETNPPARPL